MADSALLLEDGFFLLQEDDVSHILLDETPTPEPPTPGTETIGARGGGSRTALGRSAQTSGGKLVKRVTEEELRKAYNKAMGIAEPVEAVAEVTPAAPEYVPPPTSPAMLDAMANMAPQRAVPRETQQAQQKQLSEMQRLMDEMKANYEEMIADLQDDIDALTALLGAMDG
jgi:hypothetical protein